MLSLIQTALAGAALVLALAASAHAAELRATLVIDAEFGHPTSTSAQAIELGAKLAAREIEADDTLGRVRIDVRRSDNRGISAIGVDNFLDAVKDPSVIAVMGGKFSPVQIEVAPYAYENRLMLLDPWGSADGIIDNGFRPNWAFRLSLKDEWASAAFVAEAKRRGATQIGVILPNTAWGRSTQAGLAGQARLNAIRIVGERWYNWGEQSLIQRYLDLVAGGAEAVVLVANEVEGSILVREVASLAETQRRPILSHWGVTGGDFEDLCKGALDYVDISIVQTFSFHEPRTATARRLLDTVLQTTGKASAHEIDSPAGVAHAYDLTWLLARAIQQAGSTDRAKVRDEMEKLGAFEGAVRSYDRPFTPDRHEALSPAEVFFARYVPGRGLMPVTR